jgi:hypothetical protein
MIRVDFVFSYWIFSWYLAYIAKLTTFNPKWGLVLGITENIVLAIVLFAYGAKSADLTLFLLINMVIKGVPLYSIYESKTTPRDIYAIAALFVMYVLWVHINGKTVLEYQHKIFKSILRGENETPSMWLINKIRRAF